MKIYFAASIRSGRQLHTVKQAAEDIRPVLRGIFGLFLYNEEEA